MKEARANIRNSYRREIISYMSDCMDYLRRKGKEDEMYIVEMMLDVVKDTPPDKELTFNSTKLGY